MTDITAAPNCSALSDLPVINVFGTISPDKINHFDPPYSVRNDCQIGQWKVGSDDFLGDSLEFSVIRIEKVFGNLGQTKETEWLQVWLIGAPGEERLPRNTVCVTYIKTLSMALFSQRLIKVMDSQEPAMGIFKADFEKQSGEYGAYYTLNWKWRERNETEYAQLRYIATFLEQQPIMNDSNLPKTMIKLDRKNPKAIKEAKETLLAITAAK